jgi:hypothetical protein
MASDRQHDLENRAALRYARRTQRALDSALEKVERELLRLRARKTIVKPDQVLKLVELWDQGVRPFYQATEHALADFVSVVNY